MKGTRRAKALNGAKKKRDIQAVVPARPILLDLFCGCGGFSLGAARAGFQVAGVADNDKHAIQTHEKNFPNSKHYKGDLRKTSAKALLDHFGLDGASVDVVVGGPPCQGFSSMGNRRVRDARNGLFKRFFALVNEIKPRFFVCENVPGILEQRYDGIRTVALSQVKTAYDVLEPFEVAANMVGAPTTRTRVFFIGVRRDEKIQIKKTDFDPPKNIEMIYVGAALKGLPLKFNANNEFADTAKLLKSQPNGLFGNKLHGEIPAEVGDSNTMTLLKKGQVTGCTPTKHTSDVIRRFENIEQGSSDEISRFPRLAINAHCPTLRAGTGSDRGSHQAARPIHPTEHRVITPREAARLQGFPDWFVFDKTKWHSFRQIGNSVSPLVAEYVLSIILRKLAGKVKRRN